MKLAYLFFLVLLIGGFVLIYKQGLLNPWGVKYKQATVYIRGEGFQVEVANTLASRDLGLGGREGLKDQEGMLFVFSALADRTFWMKDVGFSLDIIWIAGDKVVGFAKNTEPHNGESLSSVARYRSPEPIDKVLEVAAGTVDRIGMIVGDGVEVSFKD